MTEHKLNAVNLKSSDYAESDKTLTLFSYENGLVFARAKGVKKARAKLKHAVGPFCFGEYVLCESKSGFILCGFEHKEFFYSIREDLEKYYTASAFAEYCILFVQQNQPERALFKLLLNCLNALCYADAKPKNLLLYFLTNALKCSGYNIDYQNCTVCGGVIEKCTLVDLSGGGFLCNNCSGTVRSSMAAAIHKTMKFIASAGEERLNTIKADNRHIFAAIDCVNAFIEDICGKKLKTISEIKKQYI